MHLFAVRAIRLAFTYVALPLLAIATGCTAGNAPSQSVPAAPKAAQQLSGPEQWAKAAEEMKPTVDGIPSHWVVPPAPDAPVVKLTAAEFGNELKADKQATLEKYKGKWLEITGIVESVSKKNLSGESQLAMAGQDDLPANHKLYHLDLSKYLVFNMTDPALWESTSPGAKVIMRGTLARVPGGAGFDHSTMIDNQGQPVPNITAEELATLYIEDSGAFKAKYEGKTFVVSGEFSKYIGEYNRPTFKVSNDVVISLDYLGSNIDFENLQVGELLIACGICTYYSPDSAPPNVKIDSAFRVPQKTSAQITPGEKRAQ